MECQKKSNLKKCPCTYDCKTKGFCCQCLQFHLKRKELPGCCFSQKTEKTYDRSFKKFMEENKI